MAKQLIEKAYTFYKRKDTSETHIFEGDFTQEKCTSNRLSICKKVNRLTDEVERIVPCLNQNEARKRAAIIGRTVCGTCVSHLYTTYK